MNKMLYMRIVAIGLFFVAVSSLSAQNESKVSLWLGAGEFSFDLSGAGSTFLITLRGDYLLNRYLLAEAGIGYVSTQQQEYFFYSNEVPYLIHEVQIQGQIPVGAFQPYLGIGIGGALNMQSESDRIQHDKWMAAYSAAIGFRILPDIRVGFKAEMRIRSYGWMYSEHFRGNSIEPSVGVGYRF